MNLSSPTSRSIPPLQSYMHPTVVSSTSHHSSILQSAYSGSTPNKYEINGSNSNHHHHHHHPHQHHLNNSSSSVGSGGYNLHSSSNNNSPQSSYANSSVKSETTSSSQHNYDYMNNCLQNSYFGSTFPSLPPNTAHVTSDLAGYHHQHNVIQAAKLMATS